MALSLELQFLCVLWMVLSPLCVTGQKQEGDSENGVETADELSCIIGCQLKLGPDWRRVQTPDPQLLSVSPIKRINTFRTLCDVRERLFACFSECPARTLINRVKESFALLSVACTDLRQDYESSLECLSEQEAELRAGCANETRRFGLSAMLVTSPLSSQRLLPALLSDFCTASLNRTMCMLRSVGGVCGEGAERVTRSLFLVSIHSVSNLLSNRSLPLACQYEHLIQRLNTVERRTTTTTTTGPSLEELLRTQLDEPPLANISLFQDFRAPSSSASDLSSSFYLCLVFCTLISLFMF